MMTLDKELADEKVEMFQQELAERETRVAELETELELLRNEMSAERSSGSEGELTVSSNSL